MTKFILLSLLSVASVYAQAIRIDPFLGVPQNPFPGGGPRNLVTIPDSYITLCNDQSLPCTNPTSTFTDAGGLTACPINAQTTVPGTSKCVSKLDSTTGAGGWWVAGGATYYFNYTPPGKNPPLTYGPFPISAPGGAFSGNATTINGLAVPASASCLGSNSSSQLISADCGGGSSNYTAPYTNALTVTFTAALGQKNLSLADFCGNTGSNLLSGSGCWASAMAAAGATGNKTLNVPAGIYNIDAKVFLNQPINLNCESGAIFQPTQALVAMMSVSVANVSIYGCTFTNNWSTTGFSGNQLTVTAGPFHGDHLHFLDPGGAPFVTGGIGIPSLSLSNSDIFLAQSGNIGLGGAVIANSGVNGLILFNNDYWDTGTVYNQDVVSVKDSCTVQANCSQNVVDTASRYHIHNADFAIEAGNFVVDQTAISRLVIVSPGSGYSTGTFGVVGTGGCSVQPTVNETFSGGALISVNVTNPGICPTVLPTIPIAAAAGAGAGAVLAPIMVNTSPQIQNIQMVDCAIYYFRNTFGGYSDGQNVNGGGAYGNTFYMNGFHCGPSGCIEGANGNSNITFRDNNFIGCADTDVADGTAGCAIVANGSSNVKMLNNIVGELEVTTESDNYPGSHNDLISGNTTNIIVIQANGSANFNDGISDIQIANNNLVHNVNVGAMHIGGADTAIWYSNFRTPTTGIQAIDALSFSNNQFAGAYGRGIQFQNGYSNVFVCGNTYDVQIADPLTFGPLSNCDNNQNWTNYTPTGLRLGIGATTTNSFPGLLFITPTQQVNLQLGGSTSAQAGELYQYDATASKFMGFSTVLSNATCPLCWGWGGNTNNVSTLPFLINASGNIIKLNGATQNWPTTNTAGYLHDDGVGNLVWTAGTGATAPAGSTNAVQFNNAGVFGGLTLTADTFLQGTSSVLQAGAMPNCISTNQALQYSTTTHSLSCVTLSTLTNPMTTLGDLLYGASAGAPTRIAGNTTTTLQLLNQTGTGSTSNPPILSPLSGILDTVFGAMQGAVIYRGASGWAELAPGTAGTCLQTAGAGANPLWGTCGSGGGSSTTLTQFATTQAAQVLTVNAACSSIAPCNYQVGTVTYNFASSTTATLGGTTSGVVYEYLDQLGNITFGSLATLTCSSGSTCTSGVTAFPPGSKPLYAWPTSGGSFTACPTNGCDVRAWLSNFFISPGTGISITYSGGIPTISATGGGGSSVAMIPPYIQIGTAIYDGAYAATPPVFGTWTNVLGTLTPTTNANGDITLANASSSVTGFFGQTSAVVSIEADLALVGSGATSEGGIWMFDGTFFWSLEGFNLGASGASSYYISLNKYTSSGTFSSSVAQGIPIFGKAILKESVSGTTLTYSVSLNDGSSFIPIGTPATVSTITKSGVLLKFSAGTNPSYMDVKSMVLH